MLEPNELQSKIIDKFEKYEKYLNTETKIATPTLGLLHSKNIPDLGFVGKKWLDHLNIKEGKMIKIGGTSRDPKTKAFKERPINHPFYNNLEYYNFDLIDDGMPNTIVGNIADAHMLKDNEYDFIYSEDTFEHIEEPWKAAEEMVRILKPGGLCFIFTCFSWRYHEVPVDYWRFTPACLKFLFKKLECLEANWDHRNRRGPIQGHENSGANDMVPEDHLGAWIENWRVYYAGKKRL